MKKERTSIKINDCVIKVVKIANDYLVLSITGRENGFKTGVKLTTEQAKQLYNVIKDSECISTSVANHTISNVYAKQVEYTKASDETDFSYKYYEDKNCTINTTAVGGHCIISLSSNKNYRTISFEVRKYMNIIRELKDFINSVHMELNMQEW